MALKLGELVAFLRLDNKQFEAGLAKSKAEMQASGNDMDRSAASTALGVARSWLAGLASIARGSKTNSGQLARDIDVAKTKVKDLAKEYDRTGNKTVLGDLGKARSELKALESAASELATGGLATARTALNNFGTGVTNVVSNVWNLIPVILGLAAAMVFAQPAAYLLGGALGALPALAVGAGAALGALGLGFMGLSSHFQKTASAGSSVVDRAYQIAQAERHVRDANMEVLASQEALNAARLTAAQRMRDLTRNLAGAHLDEEAAVAAVAAAERDLEAARLTENPDRIKAADLALRQQQQSLADVRDRVTDLTAEQADAARKGVEGSDVVRAALDRQRKAVEGVTDAQHGLEVAQRPLAGAATQMAKLAPSALEFVAAIKSLKPAFDSLQLDVQQKLFAGIGGEIKTLAAAWLPTLHERLGGMATMFNGLFKDLATSAKKPEFIANISTGMASVQGFIERIGKSLTGPFMDAFGRLSKAAAPFITALGDGIAGIVEGFSAWIKKADESGSLKTFFEKAAEFLNEVFAIGKDVASILGSVVSIFTQAEDKNPEQTQIGRLREGMDKLAAWFKDPGNQKKIADFFTKIEDVLIWFKDTAIPTVAGWIKKVEEWATKLNGWAQKVGGFKDGVVGIFTAVGDAASGLWTNHIEPVVTWIHGAWDTLSQKFQEGLDVFNRIVTSTVNLSLWLIEQAFKPIAAAAVWLWDTILKPVWDKIAAGATWLWEHALKPVWDKISGAAGTLADGFKDAFGKIAGYVSDAFTNALGYAKTGMNGLIGMLNAAIGFINTKVIDNANKVPGVNYPHIPDIPKLANGGYIPATPGGRVVRMAEAGQDEIASPVDQLRRIVAEELARAQGDQPGVIENHIHIGDEVTRVVRTEVRESNRALKRGVTAGAGSR